MSVTVPSVVREVITAIEGAVRAELPAIERTVRAGLSTVERAVRARLPTGPVAPPVSVTELIEGLTPTQLIVLVAVTMLVCTALVVAVAVRVVVPAVVTVTLGSWRRLIGFVPDGSFGLAMAMLAIVALGVSGSVFGASLVVDDGARQSGLGPAEDRLAFGEDAVPGPTATRGATADADGDRLPDAWERAGETPGGVPLPDADPDRKDLYLQVDYADGVEPLTEAERTALTRTWAGMDVRNPDGSTGVALHLLDGPARGGDLDRAIRVRAPTNATLRDHYARVGNATCVYYGTTFVDVANGSYHGRASAPGYASLVDGDERAALRGGLTVRVAVLTHALLHNLVGPVDGDLHAGEGWLASGYDGGDVDLSDATARRLTDGFAVAPVYERRVCGNGTVTGNSSTSAGA